MNEFNQLVKSVVCFLDIIEICKFINLFNLFFIFTMSNLIKSQLVNNNESEHIQDLQLNFNSKNQDPVQKTTEYASYDYEKEEQQQELSVEYVQKQIIQQLLMKSKQSLSKKNIEQIQRVKKEREDRAYWAYICNDQQYLTNLYNQFIASQNIKEEVTDYVCEREDRILSELMNGFLKCEKKLAINKKDMFGDQYIQDKSPEKSIEKHKISHSIFQTQIDIQCLNGKSEKRITLESSQVLNDNVSHSQQSKQEHRNQQSRKIYVENSPQKQNEVFKFINKLHEEKQQRLERINKRKQKQELIQKQTEFEELEKLQKIREEKREEFKKKLEKHNIQLKERQAKRRESDRQFKEFYKEYQQQKPLYTQMEEEFEEREKLYHKVQEVVILQQIKEQRKPIERQNLLLNQSNHQQSQNSYQKAKSSKYISHSVNKSQHISIKNQDSKNSNDDDRSYNIESNSSNVTPKRNVQKEKIYSNMVREMYAPKINYQKQIELNQQREQINKFQNEKKFRQWKVIKQNQNIDQTALESNLNSSYETHTNQNSVQFNKSVDFIESKESYMFDKNNQQNNKPNQKDKIRSASTNTYNKRYNIQNTQTNKQLSSNQMNNNQPNIIVNNNQILNPRSIKQSSRDDIANMQILKRQNNLAPIDLKQSHRQIQSQNSIETIRTSKKQSVRNQQYSVDLSHKQNIQNKQDQINRNELSQNQKNDFLKVSNEKLKKQQNTNKSNQNIKQYYVDNHSKNKQNQSVDSLVNIQTDSQLFQKEFHNSKLFDNKNISKKQQTPLKQISSKQNQFNYDQKGEHFLIHIMNNNQNLTPEKMNSTKQKEQYLAYNKIDNQKSTKLNINNSNEKSSFENFNIYGEDDQKVIDYLQELEMRKLGNSYLQYSRKQINKKKIITPLETAQETPQKHSKNLIAQSNPVSPIIQEKIKYANYLVHSNNNNKINDWQKDINNQKLSKEEQLNKVIIKTKNIDKKASQIESILRNNKNQFNNDEYLEQKQQLDQHYIQSIQAKLALLNKFSNVN
ncbi:transmembrane protein, putative (macronuclear) [Tetrahymena thermophila SB210]|uniref:Transmembrane protein, putative n=1 Tax=Tetrahymena thermophila (strain SB210) TaxID=312017 RepID=Q22BG9_TETTS|nr:transmembrane protein, putative [Tetrahymena thermophila SB210]EAR82635.3 transmembrane protein, putative [Tetrahymena thermophila SB210]|eukprot:XP_001030298.3 transmembrane protein, putative [Tetrahymena thermophila SB210]